MGLFPTMNLSLKELYTNRYLRALTGIVSISVLLTSHFYQSFQTTVSCDIFSSQLYLNDKYQCLTETVLETLFDLLYRNKLLSLSEISLIWLINSVFDGKVGLFQNFRICFVAICIVNRL